VLQKASTSTLRMFLCFMLFLLICTLQAEVLKTLGFLVSEDKFGTDAGPFGTLGVPFGTLEGLFGTLGAPFGTDETSMATT